MATREQLYQCFSPQLIEALAKVIRSEINIVRQNPTTVLAERTDEQLLDAIWTELETLPDFPWQAN